MDQCSRKVLLEYRIATSSQGWKSLNRLAIWSIAMTPILVFVAGTVWELDRGFVIAFFAVTVAVLVGVTTASIKDIRNPRDFECRLDTERLECVCPIKEFGHSFSMAIRDIVLLEHVDVGGDDSRDARWFISNVQGDFFYLASAYGNPADEFIRLIRSLRPDLIEISRNRERTVFGDPAAEHKVQNLKFENEFRKLLMVGLLVAVAFVVAWVLADLAVF